MRTRHRSLLSGCTLTLVGLCALLLFQSRTLDQMVSLSRSRSELGGRKHARITLVAYWTGSGDASYLPAFFHSAAQQARSLDLLWVNIKDASTGRCLDVAPYTNEASNIRTLCISRAEEQDRLAHVLCDRSHGWKCDGPASAERTGVTSKLANMKLGGRNNELKLFRGLTFRDQIKTDWWGWITPDAIIGDFDRLFPWSAMDDFDVITFAANPLEPVQLQNPFSAFKTASLSKQWHHIDALANLEAFEKLPLETGLSDGIESQWLFREPKMASELDVLIVTSGLSQPVAEEASVYAINGKVATFYDATSRKVVADWARRKSSPVSFTEHGVARYLNLTDLGGAASGCPLFPVETSTTGLCPTPHVLAMPWESAANTYYMRIDGTWLERIEQKSPAELFNTNLGIVDQLLQHLGSVKDSGWFRWPNSDDLMGGFDGMVIKTRPTRISAWSLDSQTSGGEIWSASG